MPPSNRALVTPLVVVLGGAAIASVLAQLAATLWYRHWRRDRGPGRHVVVSWSDDDAEGYKDKRVMSKGHRRHRQSVYYYYNTASANVAMAPRPLTVVMLADTALHCSGWFHMQRRLAELGIPSLSFDRPGCALSTPDALTSVGKVVHELTEQLRIHQPFVLVGLGVGCEHALDFCSTWPSRCAALLLIDPVTRDITTDVPALVSPQFLWQLRLREWFVLSGVPRAVKILQSLFGDEYVEENTASDSSGLHSPLINAELPPDCEDPWGQLWLSDAQLIDDIDAMEDGTLVNETWSTARRELSELCVGAAPRSTSPRLRIPSTVVTSKGSIFSCYGLRNADDYERWFVAQRSLAERIGAGWAHDDAGEHAQMMWSNVAFHKLLDVYAEAEKHFIGSGEKL